MGVALTTSRLAYRRHVGLLAGAGLAVAICGAPALSQRAAAQTNVWWDTNGTNNAGAGLTPTGNWDLSGNNKVWNTNSAGLGSSSTLKGWSNGDNAFFSAGTDAVNPFTVT